MNLLTLLTILITSSTTSPITNTSDFVIGESLTFRSDVLQEDRTIKELFEKLQEDKSMTENLSFRYFAELDHGDALHLAVYDAFKTIFGTP